MFQIFAVQSFDAEHRSEQFPFLCRGSHDKLVIHFECPFNIPISFPSSGFHNIILLSIPPDAKISALGDHDTINTQFLCPSHFLYGVSVFISQNLTDVSPF